MTIIQNCGIIYIEKGVDILAKHNLVMCRECKQKFQRDDLVEGVDWIMPSKNWYYHKSCYDTWVQERQDAMTNVEANKQDSEYRTEIFDFLSRHLKVRFDGAKVGSQINLMLKKGRTIKGIYFSLIYWFDILNNPWNDKYDGIWIAELKYDEAREYWRERAKNNHELLAQVEKQIKAMYEMPKVMVKENKKKNFVSQLDRIGEMEDDE